MTPHDFGPARDAAEEAACAALLDSHGTEATHLFALRVEGELAGAAALRFENVAPERLFKTAIAIAPRWRRRGLGRAMLAHLDALAADETDALGSEALLDEAGEPAAFARACGFHVAKRMLHFRMDGARFEAHMARIVDHLRRAGRIPDTARTMPLSNAPAPDVATFIAEGFGAVGFDTLRRLQATPAQGGVDQDLSVATFDGDRLAGVLTFGWNGRVPAIDVNLVAPGWRGGWVNALQLLETTRNGLRAGATQFDFHCDETVRDSVNLARRTGGVLRRSEVRLQRPIRRA